MQRHKLLVLLLLSLALAACGSQAPMPTPTPASFMVGETIIAATSRLMVPGQAKLTEGELAPDFSFTLPDGTVQRLSDLRGKPVLLNFWATWCQPCIEELPTLQQAYTAAGGSLVVLGVNRNEMPEAIAAFVPKVHVTFPLIANPAGDIGDGYTVSNLPESLFINRDGTIAARHIGALNATTLQERLGRLK